MHDHLRDLGQEIANQHSPSRNWLPKQIIDFGKQIEKTSSIRGIEVAKDGIKELFSYREALAPYFVGLKLLVIEGDYSSRAIGEVLTELVWLRWRDFGQRNLTGLSLKNLRVLQLTGPDCLEELWEAESDAPVKLRELRIRDCPKFQGFPNSIGCLHELKKIEVDCFNGSVLIVKLPEEFCRLQKLEHLSLISCGELSSLPGNFGNLTNLRYLDLSFCCKLRRLPDSFKNLTLLRYLDLWMCSELILEADDFQNITNLEFLSLEECAKVTELPRHITNQASLKKLYLSRELKELPTEIGQLGKLQKLDIACPELISLPTSLGDLSSLSSLQIYGCRKLKCLVCVWRLSRLEHLDISYCPMIQVVDFEASSALSNLKRVTISATEVCSISISDRYPQLESLELRDNDHLTEIKALPVKLECLDIRGNRKLVELPSFARLTSLRDFKLHDCDRIEKIEGLKHCTRMEILGLHTWWEVAGIESLEQMERLKRVEVRANKGSAIVSCIETMQKWPDEILICTRAVADVSALLDSFKLGLSPNLSVSEPVKDLPDLSSSSFVIYILEKCDDSKRGEISWIKIGEGKWALIALFTQPCSKRPTGLRYEENVNVVRRLAVSGEQQRIVEAFSSLLQTISM